MNTTITAAAKSAKPTITVRRARPWHTVIGLGFLALLGVGAAAVGSQEPPRRNQKRRPSAEDLMRQAQEERAREEQEQRAREQRAG